MIMLSLRQKKFLAKKAGQCEVTLTMDEVDLVLAQLSDLDRKIAACMPHLPKHVYDEIFGDMFKE